MRIFGGYVYMEEYPMARLLRDSQLGMIGSGISEVLYEIISKIIIDAKAYKAAVPHSQIKNGYDCLVVINDVDIY